ncbi:MAG: phosphoenolpyruvate carboxylase, partial [Terrimicrobiaceae bacterium]|nr:phosphoenolpyruvate carboxylase [Terrimicrobiaceae bacterium]
MLAWNRLPNARDMTTATEFLAAGFRKMEADLRFFMECLREVLLEIGQPAIASRLPWLDESAGGVFGGWEPGEPIEQAVSIAFQLLNVVEESAAERTRMLREAEAGPSAEPGCWGAVLAGMAGRGGPDGIWGRIRGVRVEPVLTAHPTEAKRAPV